MTPCLIDLGIILLLILGISQFRAPRRARVGNFLAATALGAAVAVIFVRHTVGSIGLVVAAAAAGAVIGSVIAWRIGMIQIPAMVAFQHGMGGLAALLISYVELTRQTAEPLEPIAKLSALLGMIIGAATFSGSMVAAGKLANRLRQTPVRLSRHNLVLVGLIVVILLMAAPALAVESLVAISAMALVLVSAALGVVFSIRIGGADMPVLISFLNATAGLAASFCGIAVGNRLLVACGATVAASGSILTHVMCVAMNRGLGGVFTGIQPPPSNLPPKPEKERPSEAGSPDGRGDPSDPFACAAAVLRTANRIIIVPGYGMALAEAQEEVSKLADKLLAMGRKVVFAVHPVAGRMPGHMHVLLAEAEVDYGMIRDLKDVNAEFAATDLALVVGACDVVNPAAMEHSGTPISGMPILRVHEAQNVIVCNLDDRPGYSGVENPLYRQPRTIMLLGDAKQTVNRLIEGLV